VKGCGGARPPAGRVIDLPEENLVAGLVRLTDAVGRRAQEALEGARSARRLVDRADEAIAGLSQPVRGRRSRPRKRIR
jgi:hypothetical protein